mmetsp:Transcript_11487/g.35836  ORF Transcript_11487/g.35836 Transcript_11487/m.35836 type:complete len:276 (-) Transcript_11487:1091-1918(-)
MLGLLESAMLLLETPLPVGPLSPPDSLDVTEEAAYSLGGGGPASLLTAPSEEAAAMDTDASSATSIRRSSWPGRWPPCPGRLRRRWTLACALSRSSLRVQGLSPMPVSGSSSLSASPACMEGKSPGPLAALGASPWPVRVALGFGACATGFTSCERHDLNCDTASSTYIRKWFRFSSCSSGATALMGGASPDSKAARTRLGISCFRNFTMFQIRGLQSSKAASASLIILFFSPVDALVLAICAETSLSADSLRAEDSRSSVLWSFIWDSSSRFRL